MRGGNGRGAPSWSVAVVAAMLLVAACTGGGDGGPDGSGGATQAPKQGGVLRLGVTRPASLDPARARTFSELLVADQLFDSLAAYDPVTLEPVPALASWQASPDQRSWDFTLRAGATFADGRAITSADVKYSLERVARKGSGSSAADLLETVAGYGAFAVEGSAGELAGITTPSADLVRIALDQPVSVLPSVLGNPALGIVPREAVEATAVAFAEQPSGSGPFRLTGRSAEALTLARSPGSGALVEGMDVLLFDTVEASYRAFTEGRVDWSQVPVDQVAAAGDRFGRRGYRPYLAELFYGFNLKDPKFADARFREAIVRAVDRARLRAEIYRGTVLANDGVVVDGVAGHQADVCGDRCTHDPARARALVAEVFGGASPPEVRIDYDDDATQAAVAGAMKADLEAVGIPSSLRPKPLEEYRMFAVSGGTELFRLGWIGAYPSPDAFLTPLFRTGTANNLTGLSVADVDTGLQAALAEPDAGRRNELYRAAERAVMAQLPVVPIAQFETHSVAAERVRDLVLTTAGLFDGTKVWLASGD